MSYTLAEAAAACGVNKSTILRAIKSGKVSASRNAHAQWEIEPSELHRVYPVVGADARNGGARSETRHHAMLTEAQQRAILAEARLSDLKDALADMKEQRDKWQTIAERLTLADQRAQSRSWWQRLVAAG